jgi:hypothetical protein
VLSFFEVLRPLNQEKKASDNFYFFTSYSHRAESKFLKILGLQKEKNIPAS